MAKAALNMLCTTMAHDLRDRGIAIVSMNPGLIATRLAHGMQPFEREDTGQEDVVMTTAQKAAARMLEAAERSVDMSTSGQFLHYDGTQLPW